MQHILFKCAMLAAKRPYQLRIFWKKSLRYACMNIAYGLSPYWHLKGSR